MDLFTIGLFFALIGSLIFNLWQSVRADQMAGRIDRLERELFAERAGEL